MDTGDFWSGLPTDKGPLDSEVAALLSLIAAANSPRFVDVGPQGAREQYARLNQMLPGEGAAVASVATVELGGVPCEVVVPEAASTGGDRGALIWIHGGGFVIGSAELSRPLVRDLAAAANVVVVSPDYRLAPEHPFPAAVDDCVAVVDAVLGGAVAGVDVARVAVGGDSAGGNLAAVSAVARPALVYQLLVYPTTDASQTAPSVAENAEGYFLTAEDMRWFFEQYVPAGSDITDPRLSPLYATSESLGAGPPAYVITAGFDPLRDEGRAYARRLADAGVAVTNVYDPGQIHGFFSLGPVVAEGRAAVAAAAAALADALGSRNA